MLTRLRQEDGARYFGPFAHSAAPAHTLTLARRKFNLRGCRPLTPGEEDYKHCLYGHLKYCTAPCIGNVPREDYRRQVAAACEFLDGQTGEMERELEEQMKKAAAGRISKKPPNSATPSTICGAPRKSQRNSPAFPTLCPSPSTRNATWPNWPACLICPAAPARIEGFDISNISGTFAVASMVSFRDGKPDRSNYRRFRMKTVTGQDDFACMAETVRRRYARLAREAPEGLPDLIVIDGGKGQLNAAMAELEQTGAGRHPGHRAGQGIRGNLPPRRGANRCG